LLGLPYTLSCAALRRTSIDTCSAVGDWLGDFARRHVGFDLGGPRKNRHDEARARANWVRLRPRDAAPETVEAALDTAFRQTMRTIAEISVVERLWPEGRIAVTGAEHIAAARAAKRPTLIAGLHLGNWEVIGPALIGLGHSITLIYQQPPNRFDHRMAVAARRGYGATLVPPGHGGGRVAYRALANADDVLLLYIDECVGQHVYAPFFGRPMKAEGNIANAARLAALTDAVVIPAYCTRLGGAHFRVTFLPPVELVRGGSRNAILANVARLNATIEPVVLAHLDQWLWLFDLRFDGRQGTP
jgi:KDO2-lipid IV(A) lauroyltransferase